MSYTLLETPAAHKMFKNLPPQVRKHLYNELETLQVQPQIGQPLTGVLRAFRSLHTKFNNVHYRILYEVDETQKHIIVRMVGIRENFYKRAEGMKLKPFK